MTDCSSIRKYNKSSFGIESDRIMAYKISYGVYMQIKNEYNDILTRYNGYQDTIGTFRQSFTEAKQQLTLAENDLDEVIDVWTRNYYESEQSNDIKEALKEELESIGRQKQSLNSLYNQVNNRIKVLKSQKETALKNLKEAEQILIQIKRAKSYVMI